MSRLTTPRKAAAGTSHVQKALDNVDVRYHGARPLRTQLNKVFPSHWSFMLGEAAMYSFIVLLLSGVYLTLFFDPPRPSTRACTRSCGACRCRWPTPPRWTSRSRSGAVC
jgi:ubiquinol-cytochrome c reductase cytochrome b subunit